MNIQTISRQCKRVLKDQEFDSKNEVVYVTSAYESLFDLVSGSKIRNLEIVCDLSNQDLTTIQPLFKKITNSTFVDCTFIFKLQNVRCEDVIVGLFSDVILSSRFENVKFICYAKKLDRDLIVFINKLEKSVLVNCSFVIINQGYSESVIIWRSLRCDIQNSTFISVVDAPPNKGSTKYESMIRFLETSKIYNSLFIRSLTRLRDSDCGVSWLIGSSVINNCMFFLVINTDKSNSFYDESYFGGALGFLISHSFIINTNLYLYASGSVVVFDIGSILKCSYFKDINIVSYRTNLELHKMLYGRSRSCSFTNVNVNSFLKNCLLRSLLLGRGINNSVDSVNINLNLLDSSGKISMLKNYGIDCNVIFNLVLKIDNKSNTKVSIVYPFSKKDIVLSFNAQTRNTQLSKSTKLQLNRTSKLGG